MTEHSTPTAEGGDEGPVESDLSRPERTGQLEVLREENRRLRAEYRRATQTTYRRTATALLLTGLVALAGAAGLPSVREPLVVVGSIGAFGGILTWYLTPERVLAASVSDGLYDAHANTLSALLDELGLRDDRIYVAREDAVRLFVPMHAAYTVPDDLSQLFVVTEDESERGVALPPTGTMLYGEFDRAVAGGELGSTPSRVLADGLVEQFELADAVETTVDREGGRATFELAGVAIDGLDRLDHPAVSFFGVGLARATDGPVTLDSVQQTDPGWTVSYTWDAES